jgi:hypothetical protein
LLAQQDDNAVADCRDHDFDDYAASPVKLNARRLVHGDQRPGDDERAGRRWMWVSP